MCSTYRMPIARRKQFPSRDIAALGLMRNYREGTVIVAMIAVGMMQPSVNEIINVVPMWNGLMTTVGAMPMC